MNYAAYKATQAGRRPANGGGSGDRPEVHFASEFLGTDGSSVVVRFPYHSMDDLLFVPTHQVDWPGRRFGARVKCDEEHPCQLCEEGMATDIRVFVKFLVYTVNANNTVVLNNVVWDRPAAFADIDMKSLFDEYGDISTLLFKIKRSGTGTGTRYNIQPIINKDVYPDTLYVADFSELNQVDPVFILTKSQQQYQEMLHPELAEARKNQAATQKPAETHSDAVSGAPVTPAYAPQTYTPPQPTYNTPETAQPAYSAPATFTAPPTFNTQPEEPATATPSTQTPPRRQVTYKF